MIIYDFVIITFAHQIINEELLLGLGNSVIVAILNVYIIYKINKEQIPTQNKLFNK